MKDARIIPLLKFENAALPIKVQSIRTVTEEQDEKDEAPHSHNYYEMVWMIKGYGKLYVDLREYPVGDNTIFCLRPNQMHQFQTDLDMDGFVFSFTDSLFNMCEHEFDWDDKTSLLQLFSDSHVLKVDYEKEADLEEIALMMKKEFENLYPFRGQLLKRYFQIFLIYLTRVIKENFQTAGQTREVELVKSFMELLDKHYKEKKLVADYAEQLYVTPNYLSRMIKKNTGYSAQYHIRQRVVLEAKRLARYSSSCMKVIAYELGFSNIAHFSRFFKSVAGSNFSEFKKECIYISIEERLNWA